MSAVVDMALSRLVVAERLRRDISAYTGVPPTEEELALGLLAPPADDIADDTDWAALYQEDALSQENR